MRVDDMDNAVPILGTGNVHLNVNSHRCTTHNGAMELQHLGIANALMV